MPAQPVQPSPVVSHSYARALSTLAVTVAPARVGVEVGGQGRDEAAPVRQARLELDALGADAGELRERSLINTLHKCKQH